MWPLKWEQTKGVNRWIFRIFWPAFLATVIFFVLRSIYLGSMALFQTYYDSGSVFLVLDRISYAVTYPLLGSILFHYLPGGKVQWFLISRRNGFSSFYPAFYLGLTTGLLSFFCVWILHPGEASISSPEPHYKTTGHAMLFYGASILLTPIMEEFFYRGLFQEYLERQCPVALSLFLPAFCFGLAHISLQNPVVFPLLTLVGFLFGVLYWRCGLGSSILAHGVYNLAILLSANFAS